MPQVPQYQRQVAPQVTPNEYVKLDVNQDMFGVNVSKALGNVGNAIGEFGNAMADIKNRLDDTKILGMVNKSSEWEQQHLYDKQNGYYYKFGKDAYGQSEALLKDYDDYMKDYMKDMCFTPNAARRAQDTYMKTRERIMQGVTAHDYKQGVAWSNTEAETSKMNYINNAVNLRNNPDEISKSILSGYQAIEWQGELQNADEASIRLEKRKYRSSVHEAILDAYLGEGSLKAVEYLESGKGSNTFNLGNGVGFSVKEMIQAAEEATGQDIKVVFGERRAGDPAQLIASSDKAKCPIFSTEYLALFINLKSIVDSI